MPGLIQPHGFLLVVTIQDWKIVQASADTSVHLLMAAEQLIGQPLMRILGEKLPIHLPDFLHQKILGLQFEERSSKWIYYKESIIRLFTCSPLCILEFETLAEEADIKFAYLNEMLSHRQQAATLLEFSQTAATQIRLLTLFDRVMVYHFDEAYNEEVIAEAPRNELEPF
ncbi:hypothetical protein Q0590_35520 [Rhodocytophaga aerolata]|uniref:Phytochrome chromophore attachment site domain-containing protein n=1 Tax=Rhodocytophaga aerolata TaxID=455078 RepID=A0ABT8RHQ3_9BACT|nr:hypothetical protein [Rhodocytophaga aerolata]MDO1451637.1 hypothetical protein [Rhodocytophaga aerolata]